VGSLDVGGKLGLKGLVAGLLYAGLAVPHKADSLELQSHITTTQMNSSVREGERGCGSGCVFVPWRFPRLRGGIFSHGSSCRAAYCGSC